MFGDCEERGKSLEQKIEIPQTGLVYDLPFKDYLKVDAVSKSMLSTLKTSLGAYKSKYIDKVLQQEETQAMKIGRATHTIILEPHLIDEEIAVLPEDINLRTKAGREYKEDFIAEHQGKAILTTTEFEEIQAMRQSVYANKEARTLLDEAGKYEVSMFGEHLPTGQSVKARADKITDSGWLVDLKTARSADRSGFSKDAKWLGYDLQDASYSHIWRQCTGGTAQGFKFIAVEKTFPYMTAVYQFKPERRMKAYEQWDAMMHDLDYAQKNIFPKMKGSCHFEGTEYLD